MKMEDGLSLKEIRQFWEENPLFHDESNYEIGTEEFFQEHRKTVIQDCFAGRLGWDLFPNLKNGKVLDLGCGPGFWTSEILNHRPSLSMFSADLTETALQLTGKRIGLKNQISKFIQLNAEDLPFKDSQFDHVNCQGVIHHILHTKRCISEIARVLKTGGTAVISGYYKNIIVRNWRRIHILGKLLFKLGVNLRGRGRDEIAIAENQDELVRLYDGINNPLGRAFTEKKFMNLMEPYFERRNVFYHFFPARALPFKLPGFMHRYLDKHLPFMIFVRLIKKQ